MRQKILYLFCKRFIAVSNREKITRLTVDEVINKFYIHDDGCMHRQPKHRMSLAPS